jgi:mannan polymerase II complex MNN11 subunit
MPFVVPAQLPVPTPFHLGQLPNNHAQEHIIQWHPTVLSKLAIIPQRSINSYGSIDLGQRYEQGDFVVRFPNCQAQGDRSCIRQSKVHMDQWREEFAKAGA